MPHTLHTLTFGDSIYATLTIGGRQIAELRSSAICSNSQIASTLRRLADTTCGTARLYVRNITRGWSDVRPLRLSASSSALRLSATL